MAVRRRLLLVLLFGACAACRAQLAAAQEAAVDRAGVDRETVDRDAVQRFDPIVDQMVDVPPAEVKPGFLYNHFHEGLGRRVWSVAAPGGGFLYAMAPGSVQPARALDLRATEQQLRAELLERAPELAQVLDIRGGTAFMRLTPNETWEVVRQSTIANVFDLETGRRWEWHGVRRVAVVHMRGYEWMLVDGRAVPSAGYGMVECWWTRVGE